VVLLCDCSVWLVMSLFSLYIDVIWIFLFLIMMEFNGCVVVVMLCMVCNFLNLNEMQQITGKKPAHKFRNILLDLILRIYIKIE